MLKKVVIFCLFPLLFRLFCQYIEVTGEAYEELTEASKTSTSLPVRAMTLLQKEFNKKEKENGGGGGGGEGGEGEGGGGGGQEEGDDNTLNASPRILSPSNIYWIPQVG